VVLAFYISLLDTPEEKDKIEALYREHQWLMMYVARQVLKNEAWAEDACHDAMIKLIEHIDRIDDIYSDDTKAFIYTVTKNCSISFLRKELRHPTEDIQEYLPVLKSPEDTMKQAHLLSTLDKILSLPKELRDPLELNIFYGMSSKEIAKMLGITDSLVRKRIMQARMILRQEEEVFCHEN